MALSPTVWPECDPQTHSTEYGYQSKAESTERIIVRPTYQEGLLQPEERKGHSDELETA